MREFWQKRYNDNQKVQVTDEIKRDIWKYQVSSNVTDNAWYNYVYNISSYAKNKYAATRFICQKLEEKKPRYIDNQKD